MYNQPYFIPGYYAARTPVMMRGAMNSAIGGIGNVTNGARIATQSASKGLGLINRLGNSFRAIKGINWSGLITNTSKTLSVVNQAIPLVRQVGPMVNNMKSMLKVASIFKDETDKNYITSCNKSINSLPKTNKINYTNSQNNINTDSNTTNKLNSENDNSPTFFVNS